MENLTQEEIQNSINAAYDSVNLINELNLIEELSKEEKDTLDRNKKHIKIMLAKEWFFDALTEEQKVELFDICKYE
jgi:ribosome-interacting GTPase 1